MLKKDLKYTNPAAIVGCQAAQIALLQDRIAEDVNRIWTAIYHTVTRGSTRGGVTVLSLNEPSYAREIFSQLGYTVRFANDDGKNNTLGLTVWWRYDSNEDPAEDDF